MYDYIYYKRKCSPTQGFWLALLACTTLPSSTLCCAAVAAAFSLAFGNQARLAIRSPPRAWILQSPLGPCPSQKMVGHSSAALHVKAGLEGKCQVDPGLRGVRHGMQSVAGRQLTSSPSAGRGCSCISSLPN